ncbi:MAG: hypothetical protein C4548_00910 [Desulfobacteraceae bacterium]|jgi:hypothetical protein|nr:MAG: hypothetical protein C4548_00910 [Desulfobacteraceae bacterium]
MSASRPAGAPEDAALISDTIAFINHAVSSKALETALLTLIDDTTQTLTAANLESFYGMIPRWSWENRGIIETRITALMNAINAAQHTWGHFLHQLVPQDGDH